MSENGFGERRPTFTTRELEIIQLLFRGKSSKQIAGILCISCRTVESHRANIMRKLNSHSVTEVLHFAVKYELVKVEASSPVVPSFAGARIGKRSTLRNSSPSVESRGRR